MHGPLFGPVKKPVAPKNSFIYIVSTPVLFEFSLGVVRCPYNFGRIDLKPCRACLLHVPAQPLGSWCIVGATTHYFTSIVPVAGCHSP